MADNHLPDYIIISIIIIVSIIIIKHFNAVTKQFPKQEINNIFVRVFPKIQPKKRKLYFVRTKLHLTAKGSV